MEKDVRIFQQKRRIKVSSPPKMLSLDDIRAYEKGVIMRIVKTNDKGLASSDTILRDCIHGRKYPSFTKLSSASDFSDGFMMRRGHCISVKSL